nr:hypothetical protein [Tanacetum cinerariifolium]
MTADDMQKRKNDVKARATLLLFLPDEHQLRFSMYKTAQELWVAILKTFGGNEATKKTKKNILKQQYGNFKAEGSETLEQTGSQIKFEDINWIDEDDMEEMAIKWNMALLSMRADRFWKKTWKKISIQGTDVAGFDKSKNHALIADEETPTEFALMAKTSAESEVFDNSLCSKASLAQVESRLAEHRIQELKYCEKIRVLEFKTESSADCIESLKKELELIKKEKEGLDSKLTGFQTALKDLNSLLKSQRLDKNKEGLRYSVVPPPPAQIYSPPKKDMSWTGLPECADDTVTDYSWPAPTIESFPDDAQNRNPSVTKTEASPSTILPKPFIKFVKENNSPTKSKTDKVEIAKKPPVKYAEQYRKPIKKTNVRGNQRNWNNLKSHQLGPNFVMEKKACLTVVILTIFLMTVEKGPPTRQMRSNMNAARPNKTSLNKQAHSYLKRPFQRTSAVRSQYRAPWVPSVNRNFPSANRKFSTVNRKFPTANRKFLIGSTKFSTADMGKKGNVVKASALRFVLDCFLSWIAFCSVEDLLLRFARDKFCQTQNSIEFCLQKNLAFYLQGILHFVSEALRFA